MDKKRLITARDSHFQKGLNHLIATQLALPKLLIQKGIFTQEEWDQKVDEVLKEVRACQSGQ